MYMHDMRLLICTQVLRSAVTSQRLEHRFGRGVGNIFYGGYVNYYYVDHLDGVSCVCMI